MRNGTWAQFSILIFSLWNKTSILPAQWWGLARHRALLWKVHCAAGTILESLRAAQKSRTTAGCPGPPETCRSENTKRLLKPPTPKCYESKWEAEPSLHYCSCFTEIPRKNIISWAWKQILQPSQALDDCDPGQHLDYSVARDPESKSPSQALTSWPLETT